MESLRALNRGLSDAQRREVCFDWDHHDPQRGLLRTFIANHWQVTRPAIRSDFFTREQQHLIHEAFKGLLDPEWYPRFMKQLADDTKGHAWGTNQSIALFGDPEGGPFQFVFSGRHLTLRGGGNGGQTQAFGGPIFYGHQASGYFERPNHPGNVFWIQAEAASRLAAMLDEEQRRVATVDTLPPEIAIGFRPQREGLTVGSFTDAQKRELESMLAILVAPFRAEDRNKILECLHRQGGLERCHLMFSREGRMSAPLWDCWRLEGPAFIWHFRGFPHVHVWVHVANDPGVAVNARNGVFLYPDQDRL